MLSALCHRRFSFKGSPVFGLTSKRGKLLLEMSSRMRWPRPKTSQEETFRRGIPMHGRKTAPAGLKLIRPGKNPWYEVRLIEGRQNQIRIMFKHFDFLVEKLKRVKIGFLELGDLKPGSYRTLTKREVERFRKMLGLQDGGEKTTGAGSHDE